MTETLPPPPKVPPPKAPRPVTPAVRRRTLMEPRVRAWWLTAGVLLGISAFFAVSRIMEWNRVRWLVNHGTPATATIWQIGEAQAEIQANAPPDSAVNMYYYPNDLAQTRPSHSDDDKVYISGYLDGRTTTFDLHDKNGNPTTEPIRVDPGDPTSWTYRTDTPPLLNKMFSAALVLFPALICLVVAFVVRGRVLAIWINGVAQEFAVVNSHQTAAAPMSRVVLCTSLDGTSKQPIKVVVPMRLADPVRGQLVWLIYPKGKPSAAIPAMAYL